MIIAFPKAKRRFSPQWESVVNRGEACTLAAAKPHQAFDLALTIPDGWYRCQAMAHIGSHAPDELAERAFRQARVAASQSYDNYQRAGVLAFPITAALARGRKDLAHAMLADALALVPAIEPMASRAYALNLLWSTIAHNGDGALRGTGARRNAGRIAIRIEAGGRGVSIAKSPTGSPSATRAKPALSLPQCRMARRAPIWSAGSRGIQVAFRVVSPSTRASSASRKPVL